VAVVEHDGRPRDGLTYRLPIEQILAEQGAAKRSRLFRQYTDATYAWIDEDLEFLRAFEELPQGQDVGVLRNIASMRGAESRRDLEREYDRLKLPHQWTVNCLCVDGPMLALNERALEAYIEANCPIAVGPFLDYLWRKQWRMVPTPEWEAVVYNQLMIGSRRVFVQDQVYYFLLLPAPYLIDVGFIESAEKREAIVYGWSPIDLPPVTWQQKRR